MNFGLDDPLPPCSHSACRWLFGCVCVLQASFDPPGITVSVKKDRTLETMLQPGNPFAVSMVTEQHAKRVRKVCHT